MAGGGSIFLVEDHPDDAFLTLHALKKREIDNVVVFNEAAKVMDFLLPNGVNAVNPVHLPSLIIVDLKLPKVDGFDLIASLRQDERTSGVPVVVLTSSASPADRERCRSLGVGAFFEKPIDADVFAEYIHHLHH